MIQTAALALALLGALVASACARSGETLKDYGRLEFVLDGESVEGGPFRVNGTFDIRDLGRGDVHSVASREALPGSAVGRELQPGVYSVFFTADAFAGVASAGKGAVQGPRHVVPVSSAPFVVYVVGGKTTEVRFQSSGGATARLDGSDERR